jgi:hypothetical protein
MGENDMSAAFFKPTDLRAPGALGDLLAFHKARFGDARMEEGAGGDGGEGEGSGEDKGTKATGASTSSGDKGFPEGTPLAEMSVEQREAYWKFQARKHEERNKAFDGLTPEALADLRERASKQQQLERELMSDKDKAVLEAKEAARAEATPRVVRAEFKAAAKGVLTSEQLTALLEDRDLSKYVDANGDPDEDKIANLVTAFAPKQEEEKPQRRGPSTVGAGSRPSSSGPSLQSGAELYQARRGRRS